jgi:hypothetical protein
MKNKSRFVVAFLLSCVVPALVIIIPYAISNIGSNDEYGLTRTLNFSAITFAISGAHVLLLGLPFVYLLKRKGFIYWWSSIVAGFISGCIPIGVWTWPLKYPELKSSSSHWVDGKMVQTMINGTPTLEGWFSYINGMLFMGAFGAIGGLVLWLVIRKRTLTSC